MHQLRDIAIASMRCGLHGDQGDAQVIWSAKLSRQRSSSSQKRSSAVSAALGCITLRGDRVRAPLAMGTGLDWSAPTAQHCVRTRFAGLPVIVHTVLEDHHDLYFDRGCHAWLEAWRAHALRDPMLHEDL